MSASPKSVGRQTYKANRLGFTILELLVVIGIIALLIALLFPSSRRSREAARRSACRNNLKQIAIALHNYHDDYGCLPPAYTMGPDSRPLHSWRTLLLPYMDRKDLYDQLDLSKAWDDPVNAEVFKQHAESVRIYQCPSSTGPLGHTVYLGLVGEDRALHPQRGRPFRELEDGTSKTLVVIEVAPESAVPWMAPVDSDGRHLVDLTDDSPAPHTGGGHGLFADGSLRFMGADTSVARRKGLITIAGDDHVEE